MIKLCAAGIAVCGVGLVGVVQFYSDELRQLRGGKGGGSSQPGDKNGSIKLDGPPVGLAGPDPTALVVDGVEQVPTENSTIPHFPKLIQMPTSPDSGTANQQIGEEIKEDAGSEEEYQLLGLGVRTVSFLRMQVYVVGLYIAQADIPALQHRLIQQAATPAVTGAAPSDNTMAATSLVPKEREALQELLLDPERGEEIWGHILKDTGLRTAIRIVPTRNTDFLHLRDGWVRAVTGRAKKADARTKELASKQQQEEKTAPPPEPEFSDDSFGTAMAEFKALLGGGVRKNLPKGQTLLLLRGRTGTLDILYQQSNKNPLIWMGKVGDERLSRLIWMQYLAGKDVASEDARKSTVEGVMRIVERPIGTVTMQQRVA